MRKAFRHTGVLMMMGVVALGLLGAAYTLWYEDLQITAEVSTGEFNVDLSEHGILATASLNEGEEYLFAGDLCLELYGEDGDCAENGADYATILEKLPACDIAVGTDDGLGGNDTPDNNTLTITMSNLYPYAGCSFTWDIHNTGTVPAHVALTNLQLTENGNPATEAPWTQYVIAGLWKGQLNADALEICQAAAYISWGRDPNNPEQPLPGLNPDGSVTPPYSLPGLQLHEDDELRCVIVLALDQVADAEGNSYTFSATLTGHQWNEAPAP